MPELPEVETTVRGLRKKVLKRTFVDVWTNTSKIIKKPKTFVVFKKQIIGERINDVGRRGKNIIFYLSNKKVLLVHQKMTGHFLFGKWKKKLKEWRALKGDLSDKENSYIRLLFTLDNHKMLALSDLRKFAKVELWSEQEFKHSALKELGPEPLDKEFTFVEFTKRILAKNGRIKQVLLDQKVIAGIGNIYSDEILFRAKVHPLKTTSELTKNDLERIFKYMKKILKKSIKLQGDSFSDYRTIIGEKGKFQNYTMVYQRKGEMCGVCGCEIQRLKVAGRSSHYCPNCQKC